MPGVRPWTGPALRRLPQSRHCHGRWSSEMVPEERVLGVLVGTQPCIESDGTGDRRYRSPTCRRTCHPRRDGTGRHRRATAGCTAPWWCGRRRTCPSSPTCRAGRRASDSAARCGRSSTSRPHHANPARKPGSSKSPPPPREGQARQTTFSCDYLHRRNAWAMRSLPERIASEVSPETNRPTERARTQSGLRRLIAAPVECQSPLSAAGITLRQFE